ncbi:hypothetical protein [Bacillus pseudomycoides]|uniref:hypothetical protein n=1 Tax=Bacillus pseudomycoides TaxID=64104 RepID=UPI000BFCB783|nr:hypothetical protein [Bacillus pseudomycoides]PGS04986.1 hypothetical protein COC54_12065 [Bacillus pseudomycoides]
MSFERRRRGRFDRREREFFGERECFEEKNCFVERKRRSRLDHIREGDKIQMFSGSNRIDGTGVFIKVEDRFLVWVDECANINVTSLDVISVCREHSCNA